MKHNILLDAYKKKIKAKVHKAKAELDELGATAKEKKAQAEIDTIVALRAVKKRRHAKVHDLTGETKLSKIKEEIKRTVDALDGARQRAVKSKAKPRGAASSEKPGAYRDKIF